MRIYSTLSEETLRARKLLKEWTSDGVLTTEQHQRLDQETASELRTTNIFLRIVLFFFTVIIVCAGAGLFFTVVLSHPSEQTSGIFLLIFAAVSYAAAEFAVSQAHFHHHGIEEALAVCSVAFLCVGSMITFFSGHYSEGEFVIPVTGAIASLWIWRRFGLWYAFVAAMIFAIFLPGYWTSSHAAQHVMITIIYAIGLICVAAVRLQHRFDYLEEVYSLAEALLWLGIYLAINLKISSVNLRDPFGSGTWAESGFAKPFYWSTWVMIWLLPPVILARGIQLKDRFVIGVGTIAALLTLICNKPYLGWTRHTWDPMLLGIFLMAVVVMLRRWLASGANGVRNGFTAERLSGKDKHWMSVGSAALGLVGPQTMAARHTSGGDFKFGGGTSGGGGASSEF